MRIHSFGSSDDHSFNTDEAERYIHKGREESKEVTRRARDSVVIYPITQVMSAKK